MRFVIKCMVDHKIIRPMTITLNVDYGKFYSIAIILDLYDLAALNVFVVIGRKFSV